MKKIIILFIISFASILQSQSFDSTNFALAIGKGGFYCDLVNRTEINGIAAGSLRTPLTMDIAALDSSLWQITLGELGFYRYAVNKSEWMGMPAGTVRVQLTYGLNSPNFVNYGVINVANDPWDFTSNNPAIEVTYNNSGADLIGRHTSQTVIITNSYVTSNSTVLIYISRWPGAYDTEGMPYIGSVQSGNGTITINIVNADASNAMPGTINLVLRIRVIN